MKRIDFKPDFSKPAEIVAHVIVFKTGARRFVAICGGKGKVPMQYESCLSWDDAAHVAINRTVGARRGRRRIGR